MLIAIANLVLLNNKHAMDTKSNTIDVQYNVETRIQF